MIEARSKQKAVGQGRTERLEFLNLRVRGVTVLNPTPAFLYVSQSPDPSRENCLWQIEPYTLMSVPCDYPDGLYIVDGELIAPLQNNAKALIMWSEETPALAVQRIRRNIEYVLAKASTATSFTLRALNADGSAGGGGLVLQPQDAGGGFNSSPASVTDARQYVLPGFSTHRTLYASLDGDGGTAITFEAGTQLEGQYGGAWRKLADLPTGAASLTYSLTDLALPEQVRLTVAKSGPGTLNAVIRFDL